MERIIEQVLKNTDTRIHNDMRVNRVVPVCRHVLVPIAGDGTEDRPGKRPDLSRRFRTGDERRAGRSLPFTGDPETADHANPRYLAVAVAYVPSSGKRAWKLLEHPKFRAAYDLLALRAEVERNAELQRLVKWWGEFQVSAPPDQKDA